MPKSLNEENWYDPCINSCDLKLSSLYEILSDFERKPIFNDNEIKHREREREFPMQMSEWTQVIKL